MKITEKILLVIFIAALIFFSYQVFPIIKNYYFTEKSTTYQLRQDELSNEPAQQFNESQGEIKSNSIDISISPSDCDNECASFKEDKLKYCQEVCGLSVQQSSNNCNNKSNLEKDYCLKNDAIQNKDFKICDQISDSGVKKACKNRVTEDIIESQGGL